MKFKVGDMVRLKKNIKGIDRHCIPEYRIRELREHGPAMITDVIPITPAVVELDVPDPLGGFWWDAGLFTKRGVPQNEPS